MKNILLTLGLLASVIFSYGEEGRLLRFPHINGDKIVFSYAGDLYTVDADGGTARRLTSHIGYEMFPRFSPDGKYIAFTGQYGGFCHPGRGRRTQAINLYSHFGTR